MIRVKAERTSSPNHNHCEEVLKMSKSDKHTKRKFAMDRDSINYISPGDADSAMNAALGRERGTGTRVRNSFPRASVC